MSAYSVERAAMTRAAQRAGEGLLRDFSRLSKLSIAEKGPADFVSSADLDAQARIHEELSTAFPSHGFLFEEESRAKASASARFIVDPLDGTTNFLRGIAHFAVSIALERDGEVVAGLVLTPATSELFWAAKSEGAWLHNQRLTVSPATALSRCLIATGIPHVGRPMHEHFLASIAKFMPEVGGIRRLGSAALDLAYVAAGRFDMFWEFGLSPWDIAAGQLLVTEAGGTVTKCDGAPMQLDDRDILATNGKPLHDIATRWLTRT